ncbi:flavin-containing monooxygenase [Actinomadura sp. 3N508]|uniref:flavin-containing monooxygenase n=1 Tax=Actinomadura sp. 3N508 TaxID=3375153 RepID=UPI0037B28787
MTGRTCVDVVVIGGGQSGLAVGRRLRETGRSFVILDAHDEVGGAWRARWTSLRLFTEARFTELPGMPFPGDPKAYPSKDDMADYLVRYAERFELPVRLGTTADQVKRNDGGYLVATNRGEFEARDIVVATGGTPRTPEFASDLDPGIRQLHSSRYRDPSQLADGPVLLVGAGNSGSEIALDMTGRTTYLSGRDVGRSPLINGPFFWWLVHRRFTVDTVAGRRIRKKLLSGATPLVRVRPKQLEAAGVRRVGRTTGVTDGRPVVDGEPLDVANVLWCTGFHLDFSWIDVPVFDSAGWPVHYRGTVADAPGLYFMGLPFQYTITSGVVGGVGRDAEHIVEHLMARN